VFYESRLAYYLFFFSWEVDFFFYFILSHASPPPLVLLPWQLMVTCAKFTSYRYFFRFLFLFLPHPGLGRLVKGGGVESRHKGELSEVDDEEGDKLGGRLFPGFNSFFFP